MLFTDHLVIAAELVKAANAGNSEGGGSQSQMVCQWG